MAKILNISGAEINDSGIRKLADYIEANLPDEYTLVIGCKPSIYDVDAILIGGGNIFAVECKDWKGNIKGGTYGWWQKDGQVIENPLQQARNNAVALGKWLRDKIKSKDIWVRGLVVFTHEEAELSITLDTALNTSISVITINALTDYIKAKNKPVHDNFANMVDNLFHSYKNIKSTKGSTGKKAQTVFAISLFVISLAAVYLFAKDSSTYGPLLLLCLLTALIGIFVFNFLNRKWSQDSMLIDDEDEFYSGTGAYDAGADPFNIYDTYENP